MLCKYSLLTLLIIATCCVCTAFTHPSFKSHRNHGGQDRLLSTPPTTLQMAGFGGGGGGAKGGKNKKKNNNKKDAPLVLKPKQQWDRYANLKAATAFKVAVRVVNGDDGNEWLEAGKVKSENDESTEMAVALQRGIIAEHSKRLYPLKVLPKDRVEWGFSTSSAPEQEDWTLVTKDAADGAPSGIEKTIGFEGKPDPSSGFYCHYENGRLIDRYSGDVVAKE